jgi:hypothetical protein
MNYPEQKAIIPKRTVREDAEFDFGTQGHSSPAETFSDSKSNTAFEQSGAKTSANFGTIQRKEDKPRKKKDKSKIARRSTKEEALVLIENFKNNAEIPETSTHFPGAHKTDIAATITKNVNGEMNDCNQGNSYLCGIITPTHNFVLDLDPAGYAQMVIDLYTTGESTYTFTNKRGKTKTETLSPTKSVQEAAAQLNQEEGDAAAFAGPTDELFIGETAPSTEEPADKKAKSDKYPIYTGLKSNQYLIRHATRFDKKSPDSPYLKDADAMFAISMLQKYPLNATRRLKRRYKPGRENSRWGGTSIHSEKKMLRDFYGAKPVKKFGGNRLKQFNPEHYTDICSFAEKGHPVLLLLNSEALRNEVGQIVDSASVDKKHWPEGVKADDHVQLVKPMIRDIYDKYGTHWVEFYYNEENKNFAYWEYSAEHVADTTKMKKVIAGALIMPMISDE